jgi:hypothetical protein
VFATVSSAVALLGLSTSCLPPQLPNFHHQCVLADLLILSICEAGLLSFLNPLTGGLGGLILAVEVLVDFLLLDVTVLLDTLLTGLALALGGLTL